MHTYLPAAWAIVSILTGMRLLTHLPQRAPTLYLTFDDGPDPEETPRLLEALANHDIKATFFVIGRAAEEHPQLIKAIEKAGHMLANHSMTHAWFNRLSARQQIDEIDSADKVLERFDDKVVHAFRPPHGRLTVTALFTCLRRSQKIVMWTHDSLDYRTSADEVVSYMRSRTISNGDIMLFHGDGPVARESLAQLVPDWKASGFGFSTIG